jgi:hypothetical protein
MLDVGCCGFNFARFVPFGGHAFLSAVICGHLRFKSLSGLSANSANFHELNFSPEIIRGHWRNSRISRFDSCPAFFRDHLCRNGMYCSTK